MTEQQKEDKLKAQFLEDRKLDLKAYRAFFPILEGKMERITADMVYKDPLYVEELNSDYKRTKQIISDLEKLTNFLETKHK
jgi:hypothetical protein